VIFSDVSIERARILRHLQSLTCERHPDTAPQALIETARYLQDAWSQSRWKTGRQWFRAGGRRYPNILAVRRPAGRRKGHGSSPLLVGAHYDTVAGSPGADDNASGLVVLLEIAERLSAVPLSRPVWLAAFCLEEQGLLGSAAFVARMKRSRRSLNGAIVLECVGYASHESGSQRIPPGIPVPVPDRGNFLGIIGNDASRQFLEAVENGVRRAVPAIPTVALAVPGCGEALSDVRRSDHAAFWDHGFPAVMVTDTANFRNPHYHQPTDRIETLNLDFLEQVVDAVTATVRLLAGQP
jgi:Zn-dependent M28 family amino/carboxypeptidase